VTGPVLVFGGQGFLGSRICDALRAADRETVAVGRSAEIQADLLDPDSVGKALREFKPVAIVCSAGISSAGAAEADPAGCFRVNVTGTANLVRVIDRECPGAHLTMISSAAVYAPSTGRLTEESPTAPGSVYGASKLAAEKICDWHAASGHPVAVLRGFNLIGPGQTAAQVPGEFAEAVARVPGKSPATVPVRDPRIRRDFTDVRDAGRAVATVVDGRIEGTYNLCSGRSLSLAELAGMFAGLSLEASLAPRGADPDSMVGDPGRLHSATGWSATTATRQSVADLMAGL
jgi:nucleoside-diphosphate-sugar epimerase